MESSSAEHRQAASVERDLPIGIVTVSDSRTSQNDANGKYLRTQVAAAGHRVVAYKLIPDDADQVLCTLDELTDAGGARFVIFNGGTGISSRDTTYDALASRLQKTLPGFGELFRMLSWGEIGAAAMLSRATAGLYRASFVFSVPGSPAAVRLAWEKLIAPELQHLARELQR